MNQLEIEKPLERPNNPWLDLGRKLVRTIPLFWSTLFFFGALLVIGLLGFSEAIYGIPPFKSLFQWDSEGLRLTASLTFENYYRIFTEAIYVQAFLSSVKTSSIATFFCLLVGYPLAYGITLFAAPLRTVLLMLVVLPMWTAFLIRTYAWVNLLSLNGIINTSLMKMGVISQPLALLHTDLAVIIGLVYCYLPFMVLPLYTSLERQDKLYLQAASDLGCKPFKAFFKITLPLSKSGIWGGTLLVFIPMVGEFVIPELLGGSGVILIGKILWTEFFNSHDWPMAAALSVVLLGALLVPMVLLKRLQHQEVDA